MNDIQMDDALGVPVSTEQAVYDFTLLTTRYEQEVVGIAGQALYDHNHSQPDDYDHSAAKEDSRGILDRSDILDYIDQFDVDSDDV